MDIDTRHANVLFYSKFSNACKTFINLLNKVPELKQNINMICIDNKDVRDRIMKNNKLEVKQVPCILRIYQTNGYVELFEGEKSFQFLNAYLSQSQQVQQTQSQQVQQTQSQQVQQTQSQQVQQVQQVPHQVPHQVPQQTQFTKPQNIVKGTPISELDMGDDVNSNDSKTISTYSHVPKNKDTTTLLDDRPMPERAIKKIESHKANSITNIAMQMQKERDAVTPSNPAMMRHS
jgi:hypothetical protein